VRTTHCLPGLLGMVMTACFLAAPGWAQSTPGNGAAAAPGASRGAAPAAKPESPQQLMAKRAGEYTRAVQFLNAAGPQGAPFAGTSKVSVILDGHFLLEENSDEVFGKPVHAMRVYGYNNATQLYEAAWMYTMSPAILMLTGTSSDGGKTVDYTGESATARGEPLKLHAHFRQVDDDQFVITMTNVNAAGKEIPFQETTYKRKK